LFHHGGHATAARCVGHPMRGVRYWGPLATSVYPSDEPPLPPTVHLTRAAGGPVASLLLALAVAASSARLRVRGGLGADLARLHRRQHPAGVGPPGRCQGRLTAANAALPAGG
jgi:hypothetical protein